MTIPELLTTLAILGFVLAAVLGMFVAGLNAEADMNNRFQAEQNARLALTTMRKDIRSACSASVTGGGSTVTLGEGCSNGTATSYVTWCAGSTSGTSPFTLYRQSGNTCSSSTGVSQVDSLTTNALFSLPTCSAGVPVHQQLVVTFPVDANLSSTHGTYTLGDTVMLRNSPVVAQC